ncbi:hypothetical protein THAOC_33491, partial [Thalassiosira oceanica]
MKAREMAAAGKARGEAPAPEQEIGRGNTPERGRRGSSVPHSFRRASLLRGLPVPRRPVVPAGGPPGKLPPQRGTLHGVDRADLPLGPGRAALEAPGRDIPLEPDPARAPRRDGAERPPPAVHVPVPAGTRGGDGGGEHGTRGRPRDVHTSVEVRRILAAIDAGYSAGGPPQRGRDRRRGDPLQALPPPPETTARAGCARAAPTPVS